MDPKLIPNIVGAIFSILGGVFTLVGKLNKQYRNMLMAEEQVGSLGRYYRYVRVYPVKIMRWTLLLLSLIGVLIIFEGLVESMQRGPLPVLSFLLQYYLILTLAVVVLFVCAYFDLPTKVALGFSWMGDPTIQFDPGYINARWQLDDPEEIKAMNYETNKCSTLGVAIMDLMKGQTTAPGERAPVPTGISSAEIANYIFFGCVIEHWVHRLIRDVTALNKMWQYMAWAATTAERPFMPSQVAAHRENYFKFLRDIGPPPTGAQGELPVRQEIEVAVNNAAKWMGTQWSGNASRLAATNIPNKPDLLKLLENLQNVEPFSESEALTRLYLKLSTRMRVWPEMDLGAFKYPFYVGIALLLLNAGCILVSKKIKEINPNADESFRSLVASAEDKVVQAALSHLKSNSQDPSIRFFSNNFFQCAPEDVKEWDFFDFVDLWLFTQTRRVCTIKTREAEPTPCSLKASAGEQICFCITPDVEWKLGNNYSLVRD